MRINHGFDNALDISGIDRAALLAALHNGTSCLGLGVLQDIGSMSVETAQTHLAIAERYQSNGIVWFDYVCGRPIKVGLAGDELIRADLYDRDAGQGSCQSIIDSLKNRG